MAFIEARTGAPARIKVVGVGGGGQNAVNSMIESGKVEGVEFIAMNTDMQVLNAAVSDVRVQLGPDRTHGLGSGSDPQIGFEAAQESIEEVKAHLQGADMVFIAAGLGGGTGTGAAPVVAQQAREMGALTVGVVTKPFTFEGKRRMNQAEQGIRELKDKVDALIVIPDQKLLEVVDKEVPLRQAFRVADEIIGNAVSGIASLITNTGLVNVDFADVKTIMKDAGSALMGIGTASGENRAEKAARMAVESPLLDVDIKGSTGILINIEGDEDLTMHEVNTAASLISGEAHEGANIIFGANIDPSLDGKVKITVIATGFDSDFRSGSLPGIPRMSDTEVLEQIDSRFDRGKVDEEEIEDVAENRHPDSMQHRPGEDTEFDIDQMREEVKKIKEEERKKRKEKEKASDKKQEDTSDGPENEEPDEGAARSFWGFIKNREDDR